MIVERDRTELLGDALLALLQEHLDEPGLAYDDGPTRLTGGFWAELVSFRLADAPPGWRQPLVARVMPDAATAAKEIAFQSEVAQQGYRTPAVRLARGPRDGIDGRAVMVMDLANGTPMLAGLGGLSAIAKLPALARRLPSALAQVLADLHRLDPGAVTNRLAANEIERPDLDGMVRHLRHGAEHLDRPALAAAVDWLDDHRPPDDGEVLAHGDMHPFNVLVDADGTPTVLDWSAAVFAPRAYDLGFTSLMLAEPPLVVPTLLRPLVRTAGKALARRFIEAYEQQSGVTVRDEALTWHQGLICVRALSEVASWAVAGTLAGRNGHPWVINQKALIDRLQQRTGVTVPTEPSS